MINVSVPTTPTQDAKLVRLLARVNAERAAQVPPAAPFADVNAYATWTLTETIKGQIRALAEADKTEVGSAYDGATPAVQAQVDALLGR